MTRYEKLKILNSTLTYPWVIEPNYIYSFLSCKENGHVITGTTFKEYLEREGSEPVYNDFRKQMILDDINITKLSDTEYILYNTKYVIKNNEK